MKKQSYIPKMDLIQFYFRPYKLRILMVLVLSVATGALDAIAVSSVYPILNVAFTESAGQDTALLAAFRTIINLLPISDEFVAYCLLFVGLAILAFAIRLLFIIVRVRFVARVVETTQNAVLGKYIRADYQYFINHKEGELIYNTSTAPNSIANLFTSISELISQMILSIAVLALLLTLSWQGTIIVIIIGMIYITFTRYLAQKVAYYSGRSQAEAGREGVVILSETISGIKQVKVFATIDNWLQKYRDTMERFWYHFVRIHTWQQALPPTLVVILYIFIGLTALFIKLMAPTSFTSLIPTLGTFAFAVFRLVPVLGSISNATMQFMESLPNCETVYNILNAKLSNIPNSNRKLDSFKSSIDFDQVTFGYKKKTNVLDNTTLAFRKGQTTALVGRSGSGKTTVINLLLRLYDIEHGEIKIDGVNLKQYETASWLDKIGFVSQDTFIFNDTIRNNITFRSNYSEAEIIRASEYADAHGFISKLPQGYDTLVGEKGMRLSGGQRQRVAVARAMVRNPEILIFDEATNALDNISETAVQKAIEGLSKNHTVIIIAHRLSTVVNADKIIVLGEGRVLEEGDHKELLARKGAYWELYSSWSQPL
jgi:ABC-type multidrug transport system fused ATPase/permease subunit